MATFNCLRFETLPTWRARSPFLYPPGKGSPSYTPRHWGFFSSPPTIRRAVVEVFDPASTRPCLLSESEYYITPDGRSASLSWNKEPFLGLRPDFYYCQTVAGLLMWGALSDERTGLSFTIAADPCQCSYFWDSWPYFTVSDSRLPFSSPPTTRRVTVEVFDSACTRGELRLLYVHYILSMWYKRPA
jgi:hypothetical protein